MSTPPAACGVDPGRIAQALDNLLDNALRHTPPEGRVAIACRRQGAWVELTVTDTAAGRASGSASPRRSSRRTAGP